DGEALFRCATKITNLGCALYDEISGSYLYISEQYAAPLGISAGAYLDIYPDYASELRYVHEDDRARYDAYYTEYGRQPADTQIEYRIHTVDGEFVHLREYMKPIFDEAGNLTHTIVIEQDITELKIAEGQLRQAQKMEAVGQLSAGVAHDFNNLLAVILGNLELISEHFGHDSDLSELIDGAITAAERGGNLTKRLLAFSRKQELRSEPSDANRLIRNMFDLLQTTMGESIEVKIIGAPRLWMSQIDRALLESAVLNLAINARDAMESGGRFLIETTNFRSNESKKKPMGLKSGRDYVRIAVSDTGSGMTADVAEHAFEPLFTTKAVGKGSGLGLSMIYGFVTQSGGHVAIESVVGRGTTIQLYLPRDTTTNAEPKADGLAGDPPRARSS
ncbi:MAG: PAS domain-containing protein, partial [Myxococcales bacterium]|nr:PAS domain-containing protein [Myxococcales bacterium]